MKSKSDTKAKSEYMKVLQGKGFSNIRSRKTPSDIIAERDGKTHYFEIKKTYKTEEYFGAATLTEWVQAVKTPELFTFVIAITDVNEESFDFREYSPDMLMPHSTIPPFKIYFNISLNGETKKRKRRAAIQLTKEIVDTLDRSHQSLRAI